MVSVYLRSDYTFRRRHLNSWQFKIVATFILLSAAKNSSKALTKREDSSYDGPLIEQFILGEIEVINDAIMNLGLEETPQKRSMPQHSTRNI